MSEDRQQQPLAGTSSQKRVQSFAKSQESPVRNSVQQNEVEKNRFVLGIDSKSYTDMVVRFSKDKDSAEGFSIKENTSRYGEGCSCCKHTLGFCVGLTDGQIEVNEVLIVSTGVTSYLAMTCTASVQSGDFTVLQHQANVSDHFIFRIRLKRHKQFQTRLLTYRVRSEKCSSLMLLKKNESTLSEMRYLELRIPRQRKSDWMSETTFDQMQQVFKKLSSRISLTVSTPRNDNLTAALDTSQSSLIDLTDTRRVQGADFGPDFITLPAEDKMAAIEDKIRIHVKSEQLLKECEGMISDFESAVELDDAAGPLGNGNVTSQICCMVKEEVPHEMLDLFLMMGRLRVQKKKEAASKKRKWDITGF